MIYGWLVGFMMFLGDLPSNTHKKVSKSQNNWYFAQCLGLPWRAEVPNKDHKDSRELDGSEHRGGAVRSKCATGALPGDPLEKGWMRAHDPFRWGMMEGKHGLAIKLVISSVSSLPWFGNSGTDRGHL